MPYRFLADYVPDLVSYMQVWGEYTPEELIASNQEGMAAHDTRSGRAYGIVDFRAMTGFPKNIALLSQTFSVFSHPRLAWTVVISESALVRFISATVAQVAKRGHTS